jgi:glycogen debranching enzyme
MGLDPDIEWLETDGRGGYASGTAGLVRTRRYHALLVAASNPPCERHVLVNGLEAYAATPSGTWPLSAQAYAPDVIHPDGRRYVAGFDSDPWPRWRFDLPDGTSIEHAVLMARDRPHVLVTWRLLRPRPDVTLTVRPLLSGRDHHALQRENPAFSFAEEWRDSRLTWRPYAGVPAIEALANGAFTREPLWYRSFLYTEERARGFDHLEDLASPGRFVFDLAKGEACLLLAARAPGGPAAPPHAGPRPDAGPPPEAGLPPGPALAAARALRAREKRRRDRFPTRLHRAADAYIVRRGAGASVIAGYPWFADWGRDTFIALRGLCLATGRLDEARAVLLEWAGAVSSGMLPNRFDERGSAPGFNSVDAGLWFVVAVDGWMRAMETARRRPAAADAAALRQASEAILAGCADGTRHGIRAAGDGLVACGAPGVALTWMDAVVDGRAVTPRIGKPVEVQALWINALAVGARSSGSGSGRWRDLHDRALAAFRARFWNAADGRLFDVVDVDHRAGADDPSFRPNQILAVGGLPEPLLEDERARAVVDQVETRLLTPLGPRTLDPRDPAYRGRCVGGPAERDGAYHQGTAWPWLLGPFVEAWVRVRGGTAEAKREARRRFLEPLIVHLESAGIDHISEIADGDPPHAPRGCPFQAWSVGEALRLSLDVLAVARPAPRRARLRRLVRAARANPGRAARIHSGGRRT